MPSQIPLAGVIEPEFDMSDVVDEAQPATRPFSGASIGRDLRTAYRLGCNVVLLDAKETAWWNVEGTDADERRIDVWWQDDASSRLMLLLAYLVTRNREWSGAAIRVLAPRMKKGTKKRRRGVRTLLQNARIDASVLLTSGPSVLSAGVIAANSAASCG